MCLMQREIANTFHTRLLPLRNAVDNIKTDAVNSVQQQLTSGISDYRFSAMSEWVSEKSWLTCRLGL